MLKSHLPKLNVFCDWVEPQASEMVTEYVPLFVTA